MYTYATSASYLYFRMCCSDLPLFVSLRAGIQAPLSQLSNVHVHSLILIPHHYIADDRYSSLKYANVFDF